MRCAWVVVLVACAKHGAEKVPPSPGSAAVAVAPVVHTKLVGCAPAQLAPRGDRPSLEERMARAKEAAPPVEAHDLGSADGLGGVPDVVWDTAGSSHAGKRPPRPRPPITHAPEPPPAPVHVGDAKVWTPYAAGEGLAPNDIATAAATELETAIRGKLAKLDECIGDRTGSVRAVLFVAFDGGVISARVGGLGDHQVDACVAGALIGLKVGAPPIVSEVARDLSRGEPAPWRVTVDGGYDVKVEAHATGLSRYGAIDAAEHSVLVVADADASPAVIDSAIDVAPVRSAVVVAVKADAGAPVFLGVGFDARTARGGDGEPVSIDLRGAPHACADDEAFATGTPAQLAAALAGRCKTDPCGTLSIALGGRLGAKDVLAYANAARDAGFTRILVGGSGCDQSASGSSSGTGISSGGSSPSAGGNAPSIARPSSR